MSPSASDASAGDAWLTPGRFVALLGLLLFALFPDVLLGTRTFAFRDFGLYSYPVAHHVRESRWRGEVPLWNPLSNCGLPFFAQWSTMALYPPFVFCLLFPLSWALGVFSALHLLWAGLGMYLLAHRWTSSRLGAAAALLVPALVEGQAPRRLLLGRFALMVALVTALAAPGFHPRATVFLPELAHGQFAATTTASVAMKSFAAHRLECEVTAAQPAVLVIAQAHYPAWKARGDGVPATLWHANHAFQALSVSAGTTRVMLTYKDRAYTVGKWLSLLALAGCGAAWFISRRTTAATPATA